MSHLIYFVSPTLEPYCIRETAPITRYASGSAPKLQDYTAEELSSIRAVLRKVTALRIANEQDAEDLVQDTFLTMIAKYPQADIQKGLLVWSMGILRKKVGNYYRKVQRYTGLNERSSREGLGAQTEWNDHSPELRLRHMELRSLVERIVAELPLPEREALELCLAGLSTHEIAWRLQPERYQNIVNRLYRGRRKLAKELARYGYVQIPHGTERVRNRALVQLSPRTKGKLSKCSRQKRVVLAGEALYHEMRC